MANKSHLLVRFGLSGLLLVTAFGAGCPSSDPGTTPVPSDCEIRHVGSLKITNASTKSTYRVVLDGSSIAIGLGPGQSVQREVAATGHTLAYYYAASNRVACSSSQPKVPQCTTVPLSCDAEECSQYKLGTLQLENHSSHGYTYRAIVDGYNYGDIPVNGTLSVVVSAGTNHKIDFLLPSGARACASGNYSVNACATLRVWCTTFAGEAQ